MVRDTCSGKWRRSLWGSVIPGRKVLQPVSLLLETWIGTTYPFSRLLRQCQALEQKWKHVDLCWRACGEFSALQNNVTWPSFCFPCKLATSLWSQNLMTQAGRQYAKSQHLKCSFACWVWKRPLLDPQCKSAQKFLIWRKYCCTVDYDVSIPSLETKSRPVSAKQPARKGHSRTSPEKQRLNLHPDSSSSSGEVSMLCLELESI